MIAENRIPFSVATAKAGTRVEIDLGFSSDDQNYLKNVVSLEDCSFYYDVLCLGEVSDLVLHVEGTALLRDEHTLEEVPYEIEDEVELALDSIHLEESDLEPDEDGIYDLRPAFLGILYNAIPLSYSEVEYERQKAKENNPFASIEIEE